MFKQILVAGALVLATGHAMAGDYYYGRGEVSPSVSLHFGGGYDGVGVRYDSGVRYHYDRPRYPVRIIERRVYHHDHHDHYYEAPRHRGHYEHHHGHNRHHRGHHDW